MLDGKGTSPKSRELSNSSTGNHFNANEDLVTFLVGVKMDCVLVLIAVLPHLGLSEIGAHHLLNLGGSSEDLFYVLPTSQVANFSLGEEEHQGDPLVSAKPQ